MIDYKNYSKISPTPARKITKKAGKPIRNIANKTPVATFREHYRQQYHFSCPINFMSDPDGLFYYKEEYFMFHQYNPKGIVYRVY